MKILTVAKFFAKAFLGSRILSKFVNIHVLRRHGWHRWTLKSCGNTTTVVAGSVSERNCNMCGVCCETLGSVQRLACASQDHLTNNDMWTLKAMGRGS